MFEKTISTKTYTADPTHLNTVLKALPEHLDSGYDVAIKRIIKFGKSPQDYLVITGEDEEKVNKAICFVSGALAAAAAI